MWLVRRLFIRPRSRLRSRLRIRRSLRETRGQVTIMFAALFVVLTMFGIIVVDFGAWYADRREAQTDADLISLAGAIELPDFDNDADAIGRALASALDWAAANDVDVSGAMVAGNTLSAAEVEIEVLNTCFSDNDEVHTGVRATVQRETSMFFANLLPGFGPVEVTTTAIACSGMPVVMTGFLPWTVETAGDCFTDELDPLDRTPILGERCDLVVGGGAGESGDVGQLSFDPDGGACEEGTGSAKVYEEQIINGVQVSCRAATEGESGDSVSSNTGVNVGKTKSGLEARLATEGDCSANYLGNQTDLSELSASFAPPNVSTPFEKTPIAGDDVDDFFEIWMPGSGWSSDDPAANLVPYDCDPDEDGSQTSPRNITLIIIGDIAVDDGVGCSGGGGNSPHCYEVLGFARMYIEGCSTDSGGFSAKCDQSGGGGSFTIHGRFVESVGNSAFELGLSRLGDVQTFLKE